MANDGLSGGLFGAFLDWLYQSGEIKVPDDYHSRCTLIGKMIDNDSSCVVNTILDYSINNASETIYKIESEEKTLEKILNMWLGQINININGVPSGLQQLSKEYFRERWSGSSMCLMRVSKWRDITVDKTTISVPTVLWFVNGSSIYVKRPDEKNYKLGTDRFFLSATFKEDAELMNNTKENIIIQKPYSRWFEKYAVPYLVRKGVLKNWLTVKSIQEKVDEVISKVLPYLFVIEKGNDELTKQGIAYTDPELKEFVEEFKHVIEKYKIERGRTPANAVNYDQKYNHLIPDLKKILTEELFTQGYRAMLSGLGFVNVLQGIGTTRKEEVINPKPFITELNTGVEGFKDMLMEVVNLIIEKNKDSHKKLFADNQYLEIVNSPLRINIDAILEIIRSGYDRGVISIQSYCEAMGFDYETEKARRAKELKEGMEDLFYPHLIQNQEQIPDRMNSESGIKPAKPRDNSKLESQGKNPGSPEAKNFSKASEEEIIEAKKIEWIRVRIENPDKFEQDSFRTIWFSEKKGIRAIIGRKKGETKTSVQAVLFDKEKFNEKEAKSWAENRYDTIMAYANFMDIEEASVVGQPIDPEEVIWREVNIEMAPYTPSNYPSYLNKYSEKERLAWIDSFNSALKQNKGEAYAFKVAWSVLKKMEKK